MHFSGRKRGGDKRGIRDYLWEERELVKVLLKRANTHTHSHKHTLQQSGRCAHYIIYILYMVTDYKHKVNLMFCLCCLTSALKTTSLIDGPSTEAIYVHMHNSKAFQLENAHTGTNTQGQPTWSLFDSWIPLWPLTPLTLLTELRGAQRFVETVESIARDRATQFRIEQPLLSACVWV